MFLDDLYPDQLTSSVYDLDWEKLSESYKGVMFDIDNTVVPHGAPADERAVLLFARLKKLGMRTMLVSNNKEKRVRPFAECLKTEYIYKAGKPKLRGYKEALRCLGIEPKYTLFVGDQVFTDIWGANRMGMHTILTEPIDPSSDEIQIVVKRWFEWPFKKAKGVKV